MTISERDFLEIASQELGMDSNEVIKYATMDHHTADRMLAEAWTKLNPQCEEDILRYYTQFPEFTFFHLRFAYGMSEKWINYQLFDKFIKFMPDIKSYRILDYGCGACQVGLTFINSGCIDVTMADLRLPLFRIMKRLLSPYIGDRFLEITEKYPLNNKGMYDLIVCIDVMEHIRDPDLVLKHLVEHINNGKYLYLETFFGGSDYAPYHLCENDKYRDPSIWKEVLKRNGLVEVSMNDVGGYNGLYQVQRT